jgi:hypothetical protein
LRRGAPAPRASFHGSSGSGAPSQRRGPLALFLLAALLTALLTAASASASKEVFNYIGGTKLVEDGDAEGIGSFAAEFERPGDSAVNDTGAGPANTGDFYVADQLNNRIQRFNAEGSFISAWGKDVIASTVNERQRLFVNAEGGTYTLSFNGSTTAPITYASSEESEETGGQERSTIRNALGALPSVGGTANVEVSGRYESGITIAFKGALAAADQPQITADTSQLNGTIIVKTLADGTASTASTGADFELCTIARECKAGVASGGNGATGGDGALNEPQSVAVDSDTGNVYVSDQGNRRIDEYDGEGKFIASFGFDVDATTAPTTYEVCPAGDVCKAGDAGGGVGQYGSGSNAEVGIGTFFGIAVSPPDGEAAVGKVYLADTGNRRVDTYNLDGFSPGSFGSAATFGFGSGENLLQPRKVAVDSRGVVYASNSTGGGEIERYDSQNANGGGVGFLDPIGASRNEKQKVTFTGFNNGDQYTLTCPNGTATEPIAYAVNNDGLLNMGRQLARICVDGIEESSDNFRIRIEGLAPPQITVEFLPPFASTDVPTMICTKVTGTGSCSVTTEVDGGVGSLLGAGPFPSDRGTQGLAVHPDSDGVGPDTDVLYVLRWPFPGNPVVQQLGPANKPGLTAAPSASDDTHGAGAGFENVTGFGLNDANGRLLVSSIGGSNAHRVSILADAASVPAPGITIDPVGAVGESTATFSGTVDPKGGLVGCKFQYSTDQAGWTDLAEPDCASLASGGGAQAVSQNAAGLDPNTHYFVRLAVSRPFIPGSTALSAITRTFETTAVPPAISDVGAIQIQDTSMRLVATIDPRHSPTGYVFEYGTTPALGSSTAPLDVGGGTTPITVSRVIGGLSPDTTYYFRLVATNQIGTTTGSGHSAHTRSVPFPPASPGNCPNAALRQEQSTTFLPDCRAYEMVSPTDKNQGGLGRKYLAVSRDGNSAAYLAPALFGEPAGQQDFLEARYLSRRGPDGWSTANPFPHYCPIDPSSGTISSPGTKSFQEIFLSQNFDQALISNPESAGCPIPPLDPAASLPPNGATNNLYREDLTASPAYELLAPRLGSGSIGRSAYIGGSEDFSHLFYTSKSNQTDPPDSPAVVGTYGKLYEWIEEGEDACATPGGCLRLASVDPAGNPFTTGSNAGRFSVSADGERFYFQNRMDEGSDCSGPACQLFMREGGATTYKVSASECTASCGASSSAARFNWTNPEGDVALFRSCDKLTDQSAPPSGNACSDGQAGQNVESGAKLYRWDLNSPPGHRLTDLSADHELSDGAQPGALDIFGAGEDGNTVFFVAGGQIVSGAPTNPGLKIYRWRWNGGSPKVDYLGPYVSLSESGFDPELTYTNTVQFNDPNFDRRGARVTPDGRHLLIGSYLALDRAADHDSMNDLYRWDEAEGWRCVSCQPPGVPSAGHANLWQPTPNEERSVFNSGLYTRWPWSVHSISDDGRHVFFETPDALLPADINGEAGCTGIEGGSTGGLYYTCGDVYEWNDGTLSLISSGNDSAGATLVGATHAGEDVFFLTRKRLVGWDADNSLDLYDARVGGGFPEPAPLPPSCEGEGCREAGTTAPGGAGGAGTAVFQGPGDPAPKHHKARKHHKKRHHKSGRANHKRRAGR